MSQVRVMIWNLENLFLPGQDGGPDTEAAIRTCSSRAVPQFPYPYGLAFQPL